MRRQDVVRRRDLNSKVKMIFEERSDAIKIDVSRIRDEYNKCYEISIFYG